MWCAKKMKKQLKALIRAEIRKGIPVVLKRFIRDNKIEMLKIRIKDKRRKTGDNSHASK